jgi:hypothetical protein
MFTFAKFKMAASAKVPKELNVLKWHCNPLNVSHSAHSKKNKKPETCVGLDDKGFQDSERITNL